MLSVVTQLHGPPIALNAMFLAIGVFGVLLCYVWYITIRSYRQLNSGKFHLIGEVEAQLPFPFYDEEGTGWEGGRTKRSTFPSRT